MRYWIQGEDEDYERERQRAIITGDALPADLTPTVNVAVGAMIAVHVIAMLALIFLVVDWLRA